MKNKRQIAKNKTLDRIIQAAKELIISHGIINLKTLDVAKQAQIAHGTLFAHFATKELLTAEICQIELKRIARKLKNIAENNTEITSLLFNYLTMIAKNESFYVVLAKEFPFLDIRVQQSILANETIIKNILFKKIEQGNETGEFRVSDITMSVSFFFASVNYYLSRKEYFVNGKEKLMNQKKKQIIGTFLSMLK